MSVESTAPEMTAPGSRKRQALVPLPALAVVIAVAALTAVIYAPIVADYFALDDFVWLRAVSGRNLAEVTARAFKFPRFTPFDAPTPYFRPATDISVKLELILFGLHPAPYHAVNLALHIGVASVGGAIAGRLTRSWLAGGAASLLFATTPAYDIAVSWISQLAELQGAFFAVFAVLFWHMYLRTTDGRRARWWAGAASLSLTLAVMSKESQAATLALFPLLAVLDPGRRRPWREVGACVTALGVAAAAYLGFALWQEYRGTAQADVYEVGPHMFANARHYGGRVLVPYRADDSAVSLVRHALLLAYVAGGTWALVRRMRAPAFFFVWSVLWLLPFTMFTYPTEDRYTYLPALPATAFVVSLASAVIARMPTSVRDSAVAAAGGVVALLVVVQAAGARDAQRPLRDYARQYDRAASAMRAQCAGLPRDGRIYFERGMPFDPLFTDVPAMANIFFDHVEVLREPPAGSDTRPLCIVRVP